MKQLIDGADEAQQIPLKANHLESGKRYMCILVFYRHIGHNSLGFELTVSKKQPRPVAQTSQKTVMSNNRERTHQFVYAQTVNL
jgi:hypothetical protein